MRLSSNVPNVAGPLLAALLTLGAACKQPAPAPTIPAEPIDPVMDRVVNKGPMARARDQFPTIVNPKYYTVAEAAFSMGDSEVVLGLEAAGQHRAYPINFLNDHELVREELGGQPLLITW